MKALVSACLLLTLLSPVSSGPASCALVVSTGPASCATCRTEDCQTIGKTGCRPGTKERICYSKVADFPLEGPNREQTLSHILGCTKRENCHPVNYTASLPDGGYIYMAVRCCNRFICNRPLRAPDQKTRPFNGLQCPGCLARIPNANQSCSSDVTVRCRGQENKCISYTGRLITHSFYYPTLSFKGCATKNLCDLLTGVTEEGRDLMEPSDTTEAECSPAEYPVE